MKSYGAIIYLELIKILSANCFYYPQLDFITERVLVLWQHKQALCYAGSYDSLIFRLISLYLNMKIQTLFRHGDFKICMQRTSQKSSETVSTVNSQRVLVKTPVHVSSCLACVYIFSSCRLCLVEKWPGPRLNYRYQCVHTNGEQTYICCSTYHPYRLHDILQHLKHPLI